MISGQKLADLRQQFDALHGTERQEIAGLVRKEFPYFAETALPRPRDFAGHNTFLRLCLEEFERRLGR